jgi:predicted O-methyltransferase YrrM
MDFLDPAIEQYALTHTQPEPEILAQLNRETWLKVLQPRMLSGHMQGRFLSLMSHLIKPKRILEIGTYTGYSAICMAEGLAQDGKLHTIDINEELETMVQQYIEKAGLNAKIEMHVGNAMEIIPELNETWDMVFIDADKENYLNYFNLIIDKVRAGGLIIADNVLWSGKILQVAAPNDEETKALQTFNEAVSADNRVESQLLPIRDGLMFLRKK